MFQNITLWVKYFVVDKHPNCETFFLMFKIFFFGKHALSFSLLSQIVLGKASSYYSHRLPQLCLRICG